MAYDYDKLYETQPQALGAPTQVFVDFFDQVKTRPLRVLDIGCGQGRDALFIARLGHVVVGVDLSPNGICDLVAVADVESLNIEGVVADIVTYEPVGTFDVVLIDRTFHMLPKEALLDVLARLIGAVAAGGWILIADEKSNMQGFKDVFAASSHDWETEVDSGGNLFLQHV